MRDQTDPSKGSLRLSTARGPFSTRIRTPHLSCEHCYGRRILSCVLRAPGSPTCDERTLSCRQGPRFPHRPAKGGAFPRRPEVRSTAMHVRKPARIAPHPRERGPLVHAAPAPRRAPTLCSSREPAPFSTDPRCPALTSQASGAAQSNGTKGWLLPPSRNPSIAALKTASVTDAARGVMCRELRNDVFATISAQMKEKKHCNAPFLLHRFSTALFRGFPHVSYRLFEVEGFIGVAPGRRNQD